MRLRRDIEHTVTGWRWLDRLTAPYWRIVSWRAERSIERTLGITGTREQRRAQWRRLVAGALREEKQ